MTQKLCRAPWMALLFVVVATFFVSESFAQSKDSKEKKSTVASGSVQSVSKAAKPVAKPALLGSTSGLPAGAVLISERVISTTVNGKTVKIKNPVTVPVKNAPVIGLGLPSSQTTYPAEICIGGS